MAQKQSTPHDWYSQWINLANIIIEFEKQIQQDLIDRPDLKHFPEILIGNICEPLSKEKLTSLVTALFIESKKQSDRADAAKKELDILMSKDKKNKSKSEMIQKK